MSWRERFREEAMVKVVLKEEKGGKCGGREWRERKPGWSSERESGGGGGRNGRTEKDRREEERRLG